MGMKEMNLHFLGTAGYHPNDRRQTSCLFIPECGLMLDAGTGVFRAIEHAASDTLDILLSHAHLDHVMGLPFVLDLKYASSLKRFRVYGEADKLRAIQEHLFHELLFPVKPPIEWIELESLPQNPVIGGANLSWQKLEHPGGSVGYRLDWPGISLGYITDTTCRPDSAYWDLISGVDYLVHECNFTDNEIEFAELTGHSWAAAVLSQAKKHRIKNLILTHLNPLKDGEDPLEIGNDKPASTADELALSVAFDRLVVPLKRRS
jgi:ribonuclease BN (tRNA processing enzyme)